MRGLNPMEADYPPEHEIESFTIKFRRDTQTGNWSAYCPEWKCEIWGDTATGAGEKITRDIDKHNDEEAMAVIEAALEEKGEQYVIDALCKLIK